MRNELGNSSPFRQMYGDVSFLRGDEMSGALHQLVVLLTYWVYDYVLKPFQFTRK